MKKSIQLLVLLSLPLLSYAQLTLTIEINELQNSDGQIFLELKNEQEIKVAGVTKNITNNQCTIVIENLKPGKYSFKYFHDENKNSKLDVNWMGIPKEGFGFSNNPKSTLGPPDFEKTIFNLNESIVKKCKPVYL